MTLRKGNFALHCDYPGCYEEVDLETLDFEEAIKNRKDLAEDWQRTTKSGFNAGFMDFCPDHANLRN